MRRNYYRKLSASIYHHAENLRIIGILAYPTRTNTYIGDRERERIIKKVELIAAHSHINQVSLW